MDKSKSNSAHLETAIEYLNRGWSVVPAGERAKRPIIRWQPFQYQLPTLAQLDGWYERWVFPSRSVTGHIVCWDHDHVLGTLHSLLHTFATVALRSGIQGVKLSMS